MGRLASGGSRKTSGSRRASQASLLGLLFVTSLFLAACGSTSTSRSVATATTTTLPPTTTTEAPTTTTAPAPSITMATDKTQYVWGEIVKLEVANSLDMPIWYLDYPQRDLVFWEIERAEDNGWEGLDFRLPLIEGGTEVCRLRLYERPIGVVAELKPNSHLLYEWNQRICQERAVTEPFEPEMIERG